MQATIFDPLLPLRPEVADVEPDAADDVRRRDTVSSTCCLITNSDGPSPCGLLGVDSVAMGGSSVFNDGLSDSGGAPYPAEWLIGGRTEEPKSRDCASTAALSGGRVSVRSMLTFELLRECGADDSSGECEGWSKSAVPSSMLSSSLSLPYCFRCLPELRRLLLVV